MSFFQTAEQDWKIAWQDNGQQTVTLQRQTTSKDTSGGPLQTWANVQAAVDVPADIQPASGAVKLRYMQLGIVVSHTIYLSRDIGALASDRLVTGSPVRYFNILEGGVWAGEMAGWPATAQVKEDIGGP